MCEGTRNSDQSGVSTSLHNLELSLLSLIIWISKLIILIAYFQEENALMYASKSKIVKMEMVIIYHPFHECNRLKSKLTGGQRSSDSTLGSHYKCSAINQTMTKVYQGIADQDWNIWPFCGPCYELSKDIAKYEANT